MKRFSAVLMTCMLVMVFAVAMNVHVASSKEPEEYSISEALKQKPTPEQEAEYKVARERMAQKTPHVQAEVKKLYDELLSMRKTKEFKYLGFSKKNETSNEWRNRANALAERIKTDDDIPVIVKVAPGYLIQLGMEKKWRQGENTADSKWNTQMVTDALNWKLED